MTEAESKVFNDPVHGSIELHPLLVKIVDTAEFQRLRNIKQLGATYFVYPGASHNRFEHSIGVCHLAGELIQKLQHRQPELQIDDKDVLCVQIAGLCHDLGHGPFSHIYCDMFMPRANPKANWTHEQGSQDMFLHILKKYKLEEEFKIYGLDEKDIKFITEQINGKFVSSGVGGPEVKYEGRTHEKLFLYEIVANKRNSIDVDKWDYFARDCHHLGIRASFDHRRFMTFVRVIKVDGELQICPRDKEYTNVYELFHTRERLHRAAYQHKTTLIIQEMIAQAMIEADPYLKIKVAGKEYKMSTCIDDMEAFRRMTDNIFELILYSESKDLESARSILQHVLARKLNKLVKEVYLTRRKSRPSLDKLQKWTSQIFHARKQDEKMFADQNVPYLKISNLQLMIVDINFCMKDRNPMECVRFYKKSKPNEATAMRKEEKPSTLPEKFQEYSLRMYCDRSDKLAIQTATEMFENWYKNVKKTPRVQRPQENISSPPDSCMQPLSVDLCSMSISDGSESESDD